MGIAQIAAGVTIAVCTYGTGTNYAWSLINEGISDLIAAGKSACTGRFDWEQWGIQKAISMLSSIVVAGLKSTFKGFKKAWDSVTNLGTLNTEIGQNNLKAITKQVAMNLGKGVVKELINYGLDEISNELLVNYIKDTIEGTVTEKLEQLISEHPLMQKALESVHNLCRHILRKASTTICKLVVNLLSQFFHRRRHFSSQPKLRSTIHRLGITLNRCNSLLLATSTSAP